MMAQAAPIQKFEENLAARVAYSAGYSSHGYSNAVAAQTAVQMPPSDLENMAGARVDTSGVDFHLRDDADNWQISWNRGIPGEASIVMSMSKLKDGLVAYIAENGPGQIRSQLGYDERKVGDTIRAMIAYVSDDAGAYAMSALAKGGYLTLGDARVHFDDKELPHSFSTGMLRVVKKKKRFGGIYGGQ